MSFEEKMFSVLMLCIITQTLLSIVYGKLLGMLSPIEVDPGVDGYSIRPYHGRRSSWPLVVLMQILFWSEMSPNRIVNIRKKADMPKLREQ